MRPRSASRLIVSWLCPDAGAAVPLACLAVAAGVASAVRVLSPEQARTAVVRRISAVRGRGRGRGCGLVRVITGEGGRRELVTTNLPRGGTRGQMLVTQ